jgi:AraC family transcriptional activator of pobA
MLCFAPYQPFMIWSGAPVRGWALHFHPDFFCIHKHDREVACNSVLFNTVYEPPFLALEAQEWEKFGVFIAEMLEEMHNSELAQYELLVSQLKIFLIHATRLKLKDNAEKEQGWGVETKEPFILQNLKDALEQHYRTKHSASEYADLLNISAKALAKLTKRYYSKTLTDIIAERIIIEAKRELYLTSKTVKEIAYELGFNDEHYFSRFFKINADVSPQIYRDTVGFARAEMS